VTPPRQVKGIRGWPAAERPRERLLAKGPLALSDAELLAILLRTGPRRQNAVELARAMLKRFDGLPDLGRRLPKEFMQIPGIGSAKAASLAAAFELGRRFLSERNAPRTAFRSSRDVAAYFSPLLSGLKREVFRIAILDSRHRLIKAKTVTVGTLNLALVHPREVFREAIVEDAGGIVLVHNHPGGDPSPSEEDIRLTRQLSSAGEALGIPVLDHLVIAAAGFYSFADSRRLKS
jgi:DNA repair protein RadC